MLTNSVEPIKQLLDERKAINIQSIYVAKSTTIADFMIVCTATSSPHAKSLADECIKWLKKNGRNNHQEGNESSGWVLIDGGDVIIHIMSEEMRDFYQLESLWSD